jgi:hypothetical protein
LLELGPDTEPPSAPWRRRMAEQRKGMVAPRVFSSIVARSPMIRGVMTAMNWISPDPAHVMTRWHATFEDGAAWIAATHGTLVPVLRRLHEEVLPAST